MYFLNKDQINDYCAAMNKKHCTSPNLLLLGGLLLGRSVIFTASSTLFKLFLTRIHHVEVHLRCAYTYKIRHRNAIYQECK